MNNQAHELNLRLSSIDNLTVRTFSDEKVGTIEDVVINAQSGEVAYVVLSVDTGFLNLGTKYFALPWGAFTFNEQLENVLLNVSKEKLENSPGFDMDNWPSGPQQEFISELHNYYDLDRPDRSNSPYDPTKTSEDEDYSYRSSEPRRPRDSDESFL